MADKYIILYSIEKTLIYHEVTSVLLSLMERKPHSIFRPRAANTPPGNRKLHLERDVVLCYNLCNTNLYQEHCKLDTNTNPRPVSVRHERDVWLEIVSEEPFRVEVFRAWVVDRINLNRRYGYVNNGSFI